MHFHFKNFYSRLTDKLSPFILYSSTLPYKLNRLPIRIKLAIVLISCAVFTPIALVAYTAALEEKSLLERICTLILSKPS